MFKLVIGLAIFSVLFANEGKEIARNRHSYRSEDMPSRSQRRHSQELLLILHAKDGHVGVDTQNQYFLTLYNVNKNVTYFTDRPSRKAGKISVEAFLKNWDLGKDSFRQDKPNAGLVTFLDFKTKGQGFSDVPLILSNPQYDQKNNRLIFDVKTLERQETIPTGDLGETTLFIDGICMRCAQEASI